MKCKHGNTGDCQQCEKVLSIPEFKKRLLESYNKLVEQGMIIDLGKIEKDQDKAISTGIDIIADGIKKEQQELRKEFRKYADRRCKRCKHNYEPKGE